MKTFWLSAGGRAARYSCIAFRAGRGNGTVRCLFPLPNRKVTEPDRSPIITSSSSRATRSPTSSPTLSQSAANDVDAEEEGMDGGLQATRFMPLDKPNLKVRIPKLSGMADPEQRARILHSLANLSDQGA